MLPVITIAVPSYGLFAFIGMFAVLVFLCFRIEKYGIDFYDLLKLAVFLIPSLLFGGTALSVMSRLPLIAQGVHPLNLILRGGLVFYGGLFGVIVGAKIFSRFSKYSSTEILRFLAPGFPLFIIFGRIGCYMAGCCFGVFLAHPFNLLNLILFARVPTQLIESMFALLLLVVMVAIEKHKTSAWDSLKFFLISYAVFRFGLEFFRGDAARGIHFGVSTSQWISMMIVGYYGAVCIMRCRSNAVSRLKSNASDAGNR